MADPEDAKRFASIHNTPTIARVPRFTATLGHDDAMPSAYGKRHRNTVPRRQVGGTSKITVSARMTEEVHAKATAMAEGLNVSLSALLAELVERTEVGADGCPAWDSKYARRREDGQEQLEMTA